MSEPSSDAHGEPLHRYCPNCDQSYGDDHGELCPQDGTRLISLAKKSTMTGRDIDGRYQVHEIIGSGGMGAVYRGWQQSVGREVAIKVIEGRHAQQVHVAKRFLREARLSSRLAHANTCMVFDFGQTSDGVLFLVMELLRGRTLGDLLKKETRVAMDRAVRIGIQLCDALDAAHRESIVHRDLKPGNIMLVGEPGREVVKVLDFGLAKSLAVDDGGLDQSAVTSSGMILGTPRYMPPEAVNGETDARSDLYSLGVILYEMFSGQAAFKASTLTEVFAMHALSAPEPMPADVPLPLRVLVMRLLEKDAADRFQTAAEVRAALVAYDGAPPVSLEIAAPRRSRAPLVAAALVIVLGTGGAIVAMMNHSTQTVADTPAPALPPPPVAAPASTAAAVVVVSSAPAPVSIDLSFTSTPAAAVTVDGKAAGTTPTHVTLAPATTPVEIVFSAAGYEPAHRQVMPDHAQIVDVTLARPPSPQTHKKGPQYPF